MAISANGINETFVDSDISASDDGGNTAIAYNQEGDFSVSGLGQDGRDISGAQSRGSRGGQVRRLGHDQALGAQVGPVGRTAVHTEER